MKKDVIPGQVDPKSLWQLKEHRASKDRRMLIEKGIPPFIEEGELPEKQWVKGKFSIIEPCGITFGRYELYPVNGDDVMRFDTLKEAKDYADNI